MHRDRSRINFIIYKCLITSMQSIDNQEGVRAPEEGEQIVTPWDVQGGADGKIDYNKLVEQFGCQTIHERLIERIEKLTGTPAHPFLKRRVFFAHRDLEQLLDAYEKGEPFYLYTGRVRMMIN